MCGGPWGAAWEGWVCRPPLHMAPAPPARPAARCSPPLASLLGYSLPLGLCPTPAPCLPPCLAPGSTLRSSSPAQPAAGCGLLSCPLPTCSTPPTCAPPAQLQPSLRMLPIQLQPPSTRLQPPCMPPAQLHLLHSLPALGLVAQPPCTVGGSVALPPATRYPHSLHHSVLLWPSSVWHGMGPCALGQLHAVMGVVSHLQGPPATPAWVLHARALHCPAGPLLCTKDPSWWGWRSPQAACSSR